MIESQFSDDNNLKPDRNSARYHNHSHEVSFFKFVRKVLPPHTSLCVLLLLSNIPPAPPTLRNFIINALPLRYHLLYI
jgi:hypothetical protein